MSTPTLKGYAMQMSDMRLECLRLAQVGAGEYREVSLVLERAKAYYEFISAHPVEPAIPKSSSHSTGHSRLEDIEHTSISAIRE